MGASRASGTSLIAVLAMAAFTLPALPQAASAARPSPTAPCTVTGTGGPDTLAGTPGDDVICGFGGDDDLSGGGGDDVIRGGPGGDTIDGEAGNDYAFGGAGIDFIFGGADNDLLNGADDNDQVSGDAGDDDVRGGAGADTLAGGDDNDIVRARDGGTVDDVLCGLGTDKAYLDAVDTADSNCEVKRVLDLVSPTAVDDDITVTEDDPATSFNVRANDTDPDGGVKKVDTVTQPANGTVTISPTGKRIIYTPNGDYCNDGVTTDDFDYTLTPGGSSATVHVTVTCVPDPAVAVDDTKTVLEDDPPTTIDVLGNDVLGDTGALSVTGVTQPVNGDVQIALDSLSVTYQPDADICNDPPGTTTDDFTYTLGPDSDVGDVHVTVSCVNDGPVADDETFNSTSSAIGNTVLVVDDPTDGAPSEAGPHKTVSGDILDGDIDVDGPGPLTVTAGTVSTTDGGTAVLQADGDFVFTPDAGSSCTDLDHSDSFDYTVNDGDGGTDTGTVTIAITNCVWYVNNNAPGNDGTSNAPFDTLAQAETASAVNDTIYVFDGDDTTTGYAAGIALKSGQRLLGERADLDIGSDHLADDQPSKRPTITAGAVDVVTLAAGNTVTGLAVDPGTAGGIAGGAGDAGGTIADLSVADANNSGTQPGLELDGTSGAYAISDFTVSNFGATGIRLNANTGTVTFADTGTISVNTSGAKALDLNTTNLGTSVFDSVTSTGTVGNVSLTTTTGTVTFGDLVLSTTGGATAAFSLSSAAGVTVNAATATDNVIAIGGPAVSVTNSTASLAFDTVSSTNSASDGVNLDGLGSGSFSASGGSIGNASDRSFDINGGSGTITYPGALNDGPGEAVRVQNRTAGAITFSGNVADSNDAGGGILLQSNAGGTTTFSGTSKVVNSGPSNAVSMSSSDGHTLSFTNGGLDIDTTSGSGFNASASGTVVVSGSSNTIDSGTGRALGVDQTDIGASGLTFQRISAALASVGSQGILLNNTGTAAGLTVTGNGGTCTIADTSGCSGGTISGFVGADSTSTTPAGTGIVLNSTKAPSFARIHINANGGSENYGIRGNNVDGFTLTDSVVEGTLGTSAATANKDGAIRFGDDQTSTTGLTGTVTMTNVALDGGYFTNLMVDNFSGVLNATLTNVDSLALDDTGGDDAVQFEGIGTADMNVNYSNSQFTDASGDLFQYIGDGTGGGDLDLTGNAFTNNEPSIVTGGGGIALIAGAKGAATMDILNNTMRDAKTNMLTVIKSRDAAAGTNNLVANITGNTIGVAGVANSGSVEGDGMEISTWGDGNATYNILNNDIRQYNSSGIQTISGGGVADSGQMNLNISGNTVANPGTTPTITLLQGIRVDSGVIAGDNFATCVDFGTNSITGSSDAANKDFRLFAFHSGIRQPGYPGGATDTTAFANYAAGLIGGGAQGTAFSNSASDPLATFSGTGATCP